MSEQEKYPSRRPRRGQAAQKNSRLHRAAPESGIRADTIQATNVVVGTQITYSAGEPGGQPVPLQLPRRAEHFVDREAERERLLAEIQLGRAVTVCGLGGMGKTALVAEVLWTLAPGKQPPAAFPDGVLFYSFYGQPQVTIALEQIARTFGEELVPTPALAAQRALSGRRILLVLDGAEQADKLEQVLAVGGASAVLMTSRKRADAPDPTHRLDLQPLPTQDAVSVVQAFGRQRAADAEATSQICAQVGNLPLALLLVGRYLAQQEEEASEYLAWLRETPLAALDHGQSQRESIRVLLQHSIAQLSATAQRVFQLVGFLALSPFEGELVSQILELSEREARQALGELVNYGILLRQQSYYEVSHPLLHTYAHQELLPQDDSATRRDLLERVVHVLHGQFPEVEFTTWARCEALLPHVQACATLLEEQGLVLLEACRLLNQAGWYLRERGRYAQSAVLLHLGLTFYKQLADEEAIGLGSLLNNLALLYRAQGQYTQMIAYAERALHYDERVRGFDDPETAKSINNLALLYWAQGKYAEAEPFLRRALAIREQQLGPDHPDTATGLHNLARLYRDQGKYAEAEPLLQRALVIYEQQVGPDHPATATGLHNLARLYQDQGKYAEAEPFLRRALMIYEQQVGPRHPSTATSLGSLAGLYRVQGKFADAEPLLQRALAIREQQLGPEHPDTATSLADLAELSQEQGKFAEAESLFLRALAIREQQLGPEHPDTANSLHNLAYLYYDQGKYEQAELLLVRALAIREQQLGPEHPDTANSLHHMALLYRAQGKYAEAEPLFLRALAIREQQLGPEHPDMATSLNKLAMLYQDQGKYAEAEPLYQRALAICEQQLGATHPSTKIVRQNYTSLLQDFSPQNEKH